ncbi:MAG: cofactor assembly of complex C subunit B [Prochlorothrix sp.]|nr:cofactor assembly of complex C subunit B [Prochlorothrix sp.]
MTARKPQTSLRWLPLTVGAIGGSLLFLNRLLTPALTESQARSDALGVLLGAVLMLIGVLWQQIQPRDPEAVKLEGEEGLELADHLPESLQVELAWMSQVLLTNTATRSLVVWYDDRVILRRGILGPVATVTPGGILQRMQERQKPIYLVNLKLYPGRFEFDYLPPNTQGVICQPLADRGALILGANAPRSYTAQDERWVEALAEKLTHSLQQVSTGSEQ